MRKIVLQYINFNKKEAIRIIVGIAINIIFIVNLISMGDYITKYYKDMLAKNSNHDFIIEGIDEKVLPQVVTSFTKDISYFYMNMFGGVYINEGILHGNIIAYEGDIKSFLNIEVLEGKLPNSEYELCVEHKWLEKNKQYSVGDTVRINVSTDEGVEVPIDFKISGVLENAPNSGYYFYTTKETADLIIDKHPQFYTKNNRNLRVLIKGEYNPEKVSDLSFAVEEIFKQNNIDKKEYTITFNDEKESVYLESNSKYGFTTGIKIIALLLGIGTILFISNTLDINVQKRIKQYGIMRCMGLSNKQLKQLLGLEMSIYSLLGMVMGLLIGSVLNYSFGGTILNNLLLQSDFVMDFLPQPITLVQIMLITAIATVLGVWKVVRKLSKLDPYEAAHYVEWNSKIRAKKTNRSYIGKKNLLLTMIAKRNLQRNQGKSLSIVIIIMLVSTISFVLINIFTNFNFSILDGVYDIASFRIENKDLISHYSGNSIPFEYGANINEIEGTKEVYGINVIGGVRISKKDQRELSKEGLHVIVYEDSLFNIVTNALGKNKSKETGGLLYINEEKISQKETLDITNSQNKSFTVNLLGVFNNHQYVFLDGYASSTCLILSSSHVEKLGMDLLSTGCIAFLVHGDSSIEPSLQSIFNQYKGVEIQNLKDMTRLYEKQLIGIATIGAYVLISTFAMLIMILTNILNESYISYLRENGISRALGISRREFLKIQCIETGYLGGIGCLLGLGVSIPINLVITSSLYDKASLSIFYIGLAFVMIIAIVELITILVHRVYKNLSINEMIQVKN